MRRPPSSAEDSPLAAISRLADFRGETLLDSPSLVPYSTASGPVSISPVACIRPLDDDDLSTLLSWALKEGKALIPRGAGTGMPGGNVGSGIALDLGAHFTSVGPPRTDDRSIEVGAGVVAAEVEEAARSVGLFLPPLPSSARRCTVGGMVANNAAGARTYKYGAIRDWVRELDVVMHDGARHRLTRGVPGPEVFEASHRALTDEFGPSPRHWPSVRKNSSGYALDRFLPQGDAIDLVVGSEGTLAVVTSITLDLAPVPEATGLALLAVRGVDDIEVVVETAGSLRASACEFFGRRFLEITSMSTHPLVGSSVVGAEAAFLIELDGSAGEVSEGIEALQRLGRELGSRVITAVEATDRETLWDIRRAASPSIAACADRGLVSTQIIEDSVVPTGSLGRYVTGLDGILQRWETDAVIFGHAGDANVHVNTLMDVTHSGWRRRARGILEDTADLVADLGGTLSGEHGDGRIRAPLLERIWGPSLTRAFRGIKNSFDPAGILNPGVIVPLPGQDPLEGLWPCYGGVS